MNAEQIARLSEEDREFYSEIISTVDKMVQFFIDGHPPHDMTNLCPSFSVCHNEIVKDLMIKVSEHIKKPEEIEGARLIGVLTPADMLSDIGNHAMQQMWNAIARVMAVHREQKKYSN